MNYGEVSSIVGDQVVVKASEKPPAIGSAVFNEKGGKIGVVADIIGPVEKPYYVVKPNQNCKVKPGDRIRSS